MTKIFGKSLLSALSAGALLAVAGLPQASAQTDSVTFATEGDTTQTQSLAGHSCDNQSLLENVTMTFRVGAIDSAIPGRSIRGLGVENEDPGSSGEIESCNELVNVSLRLPGGPAGAGIAVSNPAVCLTASLPQFDGTSDFGGTSGQSLPNATNVNVSDSQTFTGAALSSFTSAGIDVQFNFDGRGTGRNETADASFANGLDGSGSVSIAYSCRAAACPYDSQLTADDPNCFERCPYDNTLAADDPNCLPPPPAIPGMTLTGLLASLLGLPLIAGFFARRRRMSK